MIHVLAGVAGGLTVAVALLIWWVGSLHDRLRRLDHRVDGLDRWLGEKFPDEGES